MLFASGAPSQRDFASPPAPAPAPSPKPPPRRRRAPPPSPPPEPSPDEASAWPEESASPDAAAMPPPPPLPPAPRGARGSPWLKRAAADDETPAKPPSQAAPVTTEPPSPKRARTGPDLSASRHFLALGAGASQDLGAVVAETCDAWLRDPGSRRDVEAYWATLRDASAHGHAAGNAAARDVHGKAGFVLALCDAFRRVDESRE